VAAILGTRPGAWQPGLPACRSPGRRAVRGGAGATGRRGRRAVAARAGQLGDTRWMFPVCPRV